MRDTSNLGWLRDLEPDWEQWNDLDEPDPEASDDNPFRRGLLISLEADSGILFLDPGDVDDAGEWAAYSLFSWRAPTARRGARSPARLPSWPGRPSRLGRQRVQRARVPRAPPLDHMRVIQALASQQRAPRPARSNRSYSATIASFYSGVNDRRFGRPDPPFFDLFAAATPSSPGRSAAPIVTLLDIPELALQHLRTTYRPNGLIEVWQTVLDTRSDD